jgi:hypothetical protein
MCLETTTASTTGKQQPTLLLQQLFVVGVDAIRKWKRLIELLES